MFGVRGDDVHCVARYLGLGRSRPLALVLRSRLFFHALLRTLAANALCFLLALGLRFVVVFENLVHEALFGGRHLAVGALSALELAERLHALGQVGSSERVDRRHLPRCRGGTDKALLLERVHHRMHERGVCIHDLAGKHGIVAGGICLHALFRRHARVPVALMGGKRTLVAGGEIGGVYAPEPIVLLTGVPMDVRVHVQVRHVLVGNHLTRNMELVERRVI